jgi:hypothetical protein
MRYDVSVFQSAGECLYISVLNLISQQHFFIVLIHTFIMHITEKKKELLAVKEICFIKVYSLMSYNCSSVGSPAVALVKGKLPVQGLEGCPAYGSPTMQCGS